MSPAPHPVMEETDLGDLPPVKGVVSSMGVGDDMVPVTEGESAATQLR